MQFTVYRGANLLRLEAIARTDEPSVAYIYEGGLKGLSPDILPTVSWRDVLDRPREVSLAVDPVDSSGNGKPVALRARNRLAIAAGKSGSIAVFPPPHQFFFARELEVNLGYVWYRGDESDGKRTYAIGVRQGESAEGYKPEWIEKVFSLYNAPPGTWQHMGLSFT